MEQRRKCNIENLTFEFISSCSDRRELERIIRTLRSGEEGYYPDLLKAAEDKLQRVEPKSVLLRKQTEKFTKDIVQQDEWLQLQSDVASWESDMTLLDQALSKEKIIPSGITPCPQTDRIIYTNKVSAGSQPKPSESSKRISSSNYRAWDKYDVERALLQMDINEEKKLEEDRRRRNIVENTIRKIPIITKPNEACEALSHDMQQVLSNKAKDKGNEYFKSSDFLLALAQYDESIEYSPNIAAFNNRAMTHIKLGRYNNAISDCNWVLERDAKNVKALLRRGTAKQLLSSESDWREALQDFQSVIDIEPNNKQAQTEYSVLKKKLKLSDTKPVRLKIEDYFSVPKEHRIEKDTEKLPLTYYGPSTSNFRVEPLSVAHRMLSGPNIWGTVSCRCNNGLRLQQNPLCRFCGERDIANAKRRSVLLFNQQRKAQSEKLLKEKALTARSKVVSINTELPQRGNPVSYNTALATMPKKVITEVPAPSKEDRAKQLAQEARDRGLSCAKERNFQQAVAYYSTSIRLFPHLDAYKGRSLAYLKCGQYLEAVADCTTILKSEPNNVQILLRRAEAYRSISKEPYWKYALEDLTQALNLSPANDALIQRELLAIKKQIRPYIDKIIGGKPPDINANQPPPSPCIEAAPEEIVTNGITVDETLPITPRNLRKKRKKKPKSKDAAQINNDDTNLTSLDLKNNAAELLENLNGNTLNDLPTNNSDADSEINSSFIFYSKWNAFKENDDNFKERVQILNCVQPHLLPSGMKLDADMLAEILHCLDLIYAYDSKKCASYLENLVKARRFSIARMLLDPHDLKLLETLLTAIPSTNEALENI